MKWRTWKVMGCNTHTITANLSVKRDYEIFVHEVMGYRIIKGSSVEIGDLASPHWWRGHRLQTISAMSWVGEMGAEGLWR